MLSDVSFDFVHIRDVAQSEDVLCVLDAFDCRFDWFCACRDDQLVIAFFSCSACYYVFHCDCLFVAVDLHDFAEVLDADVEFLRHAADCLQQQVIALLDSAADVVRQAAVREGDVFTLFEDDDFVLFVQSSQACRCSRSASYAADDHNFTFHYIKSSFHKVFWFRLSADNNTPVGIICKGKCDSYVKKNLHKPVGCRPPPTRAFVVGGGVPVTWCPPVTGT
ncbi:hypothetical protein SDC9_73373 [bioreactor metagenome]|uniref:Uncharacterized protein n=1 Tax=bioreactor metagenome TaxID=1076179 RepID=A0A644YFW6_9ZZZZ